MAQQARCAIAIIRCPRTTASLHPRCLPLLEAGALQRLPALLKRILGVAQGEQGPPPVLAGEGGRMRTELRFSGADVGEGFGGQGEGHHVRRVGQREAAAWGGVAVSEVSQGRPTPRLGVLEGFAPEPESTGRR